MIKAIKDDKNQTITVTVPVSKEEYSKNRSKAEQKVIGKIKIPGFRNGSKLPKNVLDKYLSQAQVEHETINLIAEAKFVEALKSAMEVTKYFFDKPTSIDYKKVDGDNHGELIIVFDRTVDFDSIKLDNIKINFVQREVTDTIVEDELKKLLQKYSSYEEAEEASKLNDTVNIDFKGFVDDEPFEGGEAEGFDLVLGSKQFIEGFEDQLVGKKAGWEGEVNVTFPKEYFAKSLAGKKAVFEVKINKVLKLKEVELTNDNIMLIGGTQGDTIEQAKAKFREKLTITYKNEDKQNFFETLIKEAASKNDLVFSNSMIELKMKDVEGTINKQLKQQDIKKNEYLQLLGINEEEYKERLREEAKQELKIEVIKEAIVISLNLQEVTSEEVEQKYNSISEEVQLPIDKVKQFLPEARVKEIIHVDKMFDSTIQKYSK
ncbi:trigger factor [Mycoplasma anatis]|uniref:Trigger factor n=1 Tax=Mycoplasmopsis anatis TaxID=171279 RepID=A0A9Q3L8C5_9BACT|nr:trigger factor [Mycoplasmopsis anatis]MBW0596283.1 trigger factor [Mycoplasmopsis anatis]MBW0596467.1 trigger factor [Mycoplasmopsis anatis]MBW0597782.1 trigger factor [Mycoplasmopsis anatis]MBW0600047.1 trigger factor [Mycoplasmopsis anatis]MBW0600660.1 trigger factor [Mycoplasmopsis anatis]